MKKHNEKDQLKFIANAVMYIIVNWRSLLIVWGVFATIWATIATFSVQRIFIPVAKPIVRPIFDNRFQIKMKPYENRLDTLESKIDLIFKPIE